MLLLEQLHVSYPQNVNFTKNLALLCGKIGWLNIRFSQPEEALLLYEREKILLTEQVAVSPQDINLISRLASTFDGIGEANILMNNFESAYSSLKKGLELSIQCYNAYPENIAFKNSLAGTYGRLGMFCIDKLNDKDTARQYLKKAEGLLVELVEDSPDYEMFRRFLEQTHELLDDL